MIQVNSDKNIAVDTRLTDFHRRRSQPRAETVCGKITRVEIHLSDVNSQKFGTDDKRCRIEGRPCRPPARSPPASARQRSRMPC